jgi:hypothetical protein
MTKARSNAVANAAKGDLTVGNGTDLSGILAAGSNGDTLVADSSTSTGLRYNPTMSAGKNFLINGNFDIWQRGTSFSNPSNVAYTADRWNNGGNAGGTTTISQQTTGVPVGAQYCIRTAYGASSSYSSKSQIIETLNTSQLWGKTVTLSVKLRRNASFASNLRVLLRKSVTVDAAQGSTWVEITSVQVANASLPTGTTSADWYTYSVTVAIPQDGTANSLQFFVSEVSVGASGEYWEMAQAQLELGSVATTFTRTGGTIQGELAACRYYYSRFDSQTAAGNDGNFSTGVVYSSTVPLIPFSFPQMRVRPSFSASGSFELITGGAVTGISSLSSGGAEITNFSVQITGTVSGLTAGQACVLRTGVATGIIELSAEL